MVQAAQRPAAVAGVLAREQCRAVLACTGDVLNLPAGYLASRRCEVPFYAYVFDDYVAQWVDPLARLVARCCAPRVLRGAAGVVVTNEFLCAEYRRRYAIAPLVIHNPCQALPAGAAEPVPWPAEPAEVSIVYTGAVYEAHHDAFRNLLAAMRQVARPVLRLHLYTAQAPGVLEREGICGPAVVLHRHVSSSEVPAVQRRADVLFLPLAFASPYPEPLIRTSAPGKMGEYLASGRIVLAHAPGDSFVSWYFRKYETGPLVDRADASALAEVLRTVLADPEARRRWSTNARQRAEADFALPAAQRAFAALFARAQAV
jgi:glycosyltransferase involved in cell wall biosynthesis